MIAVARVRATRIFSAVVRLERARAGDSRDAEIDRLRKEVARAGARLRNERFMTNARNTSWRRSA
jgi:hypothetical protein